jgi:EAL domain-containing protein (putative c-di-GMP-specific phosphodiesterase class I)
MLEQVVGDIAGWRAAAVNFGHVAINVSASDLRSGDFSGRVLALLLERSIPTHCLQLEVTESVLLGRGIEHVERSFCELSDAGIKLALDDFGTGFASLSHLKQFPVDIIKIDRAFIRDLQIDPDDAAIVDALLGLARALNIEVVAEGVETTAQRDFLQALGCGTGQGFLFSKAVPGNRVPAMLRAYGRAKAA